MMMSRAEHFDPHLSNLCMVSASVLLSSSMIRLGGWTGSVAYCRECPPIGAWLGGPGHFWKASEGGSMLPAGTEIMSFFGGRGGDSFTDIHGSFTGAPSAQRARAWAGQTCMRRVAIMTNSPVMWLGSLLKGLGSSAGGCLCSVGGLQSVDSALSAGYTLDFFVGGAWMDFWAWSCWPSLASWNSTEPEEK